MAEQPLSELRLDRDSAKLLATTTDAFLIGLVNEPSGTVRLFESHSTRFSSHRDLVRAGLARGEGDVGFSLQIASGEVRRFYRTSLLNHEHDDFAIPRDMMLQVLTALGLPQAADFRAYP